MGTSYNVPVKKKGKANIKEHGRVSDGPAKSDMKWLEETFNTRFSTVSE
jgi:hypothetical protein